MSRVGSRSVQVPLGINIEVCDRDVKVSRGAVVLSFPLPDGLSLRFDDAGRTVSVDRSSDQSQFRSLHGLVRSLLANNVRGLIVPWEKKLEIVGVGYQASFIGSELHLSVGFADVVKVPVPAGVACTVPDPTHITLSGPDRQLVGQLAADVRSVRPPEPYKGKGIRYINEHVKRKSGKAFGS